MTEEEKKTKISFPMFTSIEEAQLENTLNFHLDEFVNEINKTMTRDKDIIILKKVIEKQQKEIECLNVIHESYKEMIEENNYISKDKIRKIISKYVDIEEQLKYSNYELFGNKLTKMIKELLED